MTVGLEWSARNGLDRLAICLSPIADADNFDGAIARLAKDETPVADAEAIPRRIEAFQLLHVAGIGYQESRQGLEESQRGLSIDARRSALASMEKMTL